MSCVGENLQRTGTESVHRTDGRPRDAVSRGRPTPYLESPRPRSRHARVRSDRVRGVDRHPRPYAGAKKFHAWTFCRLEDDTAYEAEAEGIDTPQVAPASRPSVARSAGRRRTRTARHRYGSVARSTRSTRTTTRSPDYVRRAAKSRRGFATAKNVGFRLLRAGQTSPHGGNTSP